MTFTDCDVVRATGFAMAVLQGDSAPIRDVTFQDVRVRVDERNYEPMFQEREGETYPGELTTGYAPHLLLATIDESPYSHAEERGTIGDVSYADVTVESGGHDLESVFEGYDAEHDIRGVEITNLLVDGVVQTDLEEANVTVGEYVTDVSIDPSE